jgi:hypothetical protein
METSKAELLKRLGWPEQLVNACLKGDHPGDSAPARDDLPAPENPLFVPNSVAADFVALDQTDGPTSTLVV